MPAVSLRPERRDAPRLADSALRVFESGQRVLLDRLDLARLDAARLVALGMRTAAALALATVLVSGAWCALMIAVAMQLQTGFAWSLPASLAAVAAASALAGAVVIAVSARRVGSFAFSTVGTTSEP